MKTWNAVLVVVAAIAFAGCSVTIPISALNWRGTTDLTSHGGDATASWNPFKK